MHWSVIIGLFLALDASAGGLTPSTNDVWDIHQGAVVTSASAINTYSDVRNMFGGEFGSLVTGVTYFADGQPDGYIYYVEWQTLAPVTVDSFALFAYGDGPAYNNEREFAQFVLKAKSSPAATNFDLTLYAYAVTNHPYNVAADPANNPMLAANMAPVTAQYFRAEFTQYTAGFGYDGPAIVELDGFEPSAPVVVSGPTNQFITPGSSTTFSVSVRGSMPLSCQWLENGTNIPVGMNASATNTMLVLTNVPLNFSGNQYSVFVSNPLGSNISSSALLTVAPPGTRYVALNGTNPLPPYTNWDTAATNIQDAIDAASPGDTILVTNGTYATGGRVIYGASNRVAINKAITVRSVNGPFATAISGASAVRCSYVGTNAMLIGFALINGQTLATGDLYQVQSGAGAWCELSGMVSGCILNGNTALGYGGGAYSGTLNDCTLISNSAPYGAGAYNSMLYRCTLADNRAYSLDGQYNGGFGGGVQGGTLNNCVLKGNWAYIGGGGARFATLNNCSVSGNSAQGGGGGAAGATLNGCTLSGNQAPSGGGADGGTLDNCNLTGNTAWENGGGAFSATLNNCTLNGNLAGVSGGGAMYGTLNNCTVVGNSANANCGGAFSSSLNNCIVYYNKAPSSPNYAYSIPYHSCTSPLGGGLGNITNEPLFVNTNGWIDLHLQSNSPCINAGSNPLAANITDFDGNPRIAGGTVDIGAYEFQSPVSLLSYAWAQQYNFPTDGSADFADPDHDGMNNYQEWRAGTDPTNPTSVLSLLSPANSGTNLIVTWQSVTNELYYLQRATNLTALPAFQPLATNLPGQSGTTSYTDTNAAGPGPFFYRVGVQ